MPEHEIKHCVRLTSDEVMAIVRKHLEEETTIPKGSSIEFLGDVSYDEKAGGGDEYVEFLGVEITWEEAPSRKKLNLALPKAPPTDIVVEIPSGELSEESEESGEELTLEDLEDLEETAVLPVVIPAETKIVAKTVTQRLPQTPE